MLLVYVKAGVGCKFIKRAIAHALCAIALFSLFQSVFAMEPAQAKTYEINFTSGYMEPLIEEIDEPKETDTVNMRMRSYGTAPSGSSAYWKKFSSSYYRNRLSTAERNFYDGLYNKCDSWLTGTENINYKSPESAVIANGLTGTQLKYTYQFFLNSNPQFYFIENNAQYSVNNGVCKFYMKPYPGYENGQTRANATNNVYNKLNTWLSQINGDSYDKVKKIYEVVAANVAYDYAALNNSTLLYTYQSVHKIFSEGKAVCAGYSELLAMLCQASGVRCITVTSLDHEWNQVQLGDYWYNLDITFDDIGAICKYDLFLLKDESFQQMAYPHHIPDGISQRYRPLCPYNYGAAPVYTGSYVYNGVDYSPVFNPYYYSSHFEDLEGIYGTDTKGLFEHFISYGMSEGRQAIAVFNPVYYKNRYYDLRKVFGDDLPKYYEHYCLFGIKEGRDGATVMAEPDITGRTEYGGIEYGKVYDFKYYQNTNPDIKSAFGNDDIATLRHFINYGMAEGRRGNNSFDVNSYRLRYADLRSCFGSDVKAYYMHYINYGAMEGRNGSPGAIELSSPLASMYGVDYSAVYNFSYYQSAYPDIREAFGNDDVATLKHFISHGMKEGRQGSEDFDVNSYRFAYGDLRGAFGDNLEQYYLHYINYGKSEGRKGTGTASIQNAISAIEGYDYSLVYDFNYYQNANPDIKNIFGNDENATLQHFVEYGMSEGRVARPEFNVNNYMNRYEDLRNIYGGDLKAYYIHYISHGAAEGRDGR